MAKYSTIAINCQEGFVVKVVGDIRPEIFAELNAKLGHRAVRSPVAKQWQPGGQCALGSPI